MISPYIILGGIIVLSFWYLDRALKNWKKEQDTKLDEIKDSIEALSEEIEGIADPK